MTLIALPGSPVRDLRTIEITPDREPQLQRFFEANPDYYFLSTGEPPAADEAHREIHEPLPAGWPYTKKWLIGYVDASDTMVAMANVVSDLLAPNVWHVGFFVVATTRHGSGLAQTLYSGLEHWMRASGARWLRMGVIVGNLRAERFWAANGYVETRLRTGVVYGKLTHTLRVLYKPLDGGTLEDYLTRVPRDRPEA